MLQNYMEANVGVGIIDEIRPTTFVEIGCWVQ